MIASYISNLCFLAKCFARSLFFGSSKLFAKQPKVVAVLQLAKIGDMVCTTPVFAAIKNHYPDTKLIVIGNQINRELLADAPYVDEYMIWPKSIREAISALKAKNIEVICITSPGSESLMASYLAGIPGIVCHRVVGGFSPYETKTYKALRVLAEVVPHSIGSYAPREYLRLLQPLGIYTSDTEKHLGTSLASKSKTTDLFSDISGRKIGITFSAGNKVKQWPPSKFSQLVKRLSALPNTSLIIFGASSDLVLADEILDGMRELNNIHDFSGKLTMGELKAAIACLDLFIGVDTGPVYIAEAMHIPTIDIVGPMDENEQPPKGERHVVLVPFREKPELHIMNARVYDDAEALRQASAVSVDEVYDAVVALLQKVTND